MDRPRLLIAASPGGAREIVAALRDQVQFVLVTTFEEASAALNASEFGLIVVGYYFDDAKPFRFIGQARSLYAATPIWLVRALPLPLGESSETDIRRAYSNLGVTRFFNFHSDQASAEERREAFRQSVVERLSFSAPSSRTRRL